MRRLHTRGEYADDGKARRLKVREEAGHRCIRCGHPFETGTHGKGEWTPCDEQCAHKGPIRIVQADGARIEVVTNTDAGVFLKQQSVKIGYVGIEAQWRILTVHHFDGDKSNDAWWNTLALCQRCHLTIQCRVDPEMPFFFEHSEWAKPYVAGFYAWKYEGRQITRAEAEARMDQLLAYELATATS
jgi:hypothetical protein